MLKYMNFYRGKMFYEKKGLLERAVLIERFEYSLLASELEKTNWP